MTPYYLLHLTPDDNGTLLITAPALPEVTTFAETLDEAHVQGLAAIEEAIAARIKAGEAVPTDDDGVVGDFGDKTVVQLPLLVRLKVDLYNAAREAQVTRAELVRRLGWPRNSVDRLFQIDHASRLDQIEAAFGALHQVVEIEIRAARAPQQLEVA